MADNDSLLAFLSGAKPSLSAHPDSDDGNDRAEEGWTAFRCQWGQGEGVLFFPTNTKNSRHCCHSRHNPPIFRGFKLTAALAMPSQPSFSAPPPSN